MQQNLYTNILHLGDHILSFIQLKCNLFVGPIWQREETVGLYGCFGKNIWIWLFGLDRSPSCVEEQISHQRPDWHHNLIWTNQEASIKKKEKKKAGAGENSWCRILVQSKLWYAA